jgi:hypothetical protein
LSPGRRVAGSQADRFAVRAAFRIDGERNGVEAADAVAVEASDGSGAAVIDQNLQPLPGIATAPDHHPRVGGPVRVRLESQLEVPVCLVSDQVAAIAGAGGLLTTDDLPLLDTPSRWEFFGTLRVVRRKYGDHVEHLWAAWIQASVTAWDRTPAGERGAVEQ